MRIINKKPILKSISIGSIILIIICVLGIFYIHAVKKNLTEGAHIYMEEIAKQSAKVIKAHIDGDLEMLEAISLFIGNNESLDHIFDILNKENTKSQFKRMGIIYSDGRALTTDGAKMNLLERNYFKLAMEGKKNISETLIDKTDNKNINVYAVPIHNNGIIDKILFATHDTEIYKEHISVDLFNGTGFSYIVQNNGNIVVNSTHPNSVKGITNIFDEIEKDKLKYDDDLSLIKDNMQNGKNGIFRYSVGERSYYMSYEPIGTNNWYMLSNIPVEFITKKSDNLISLTLFVCATVILGFALLFTYIASMQNKSKKILEKIAFVDNLTGMPNWNKFKINSTELLKTNIDKNYAIILFDIDKFKIVNELYGYKEGNNILKNISKVLTDSLEEDELVARISADNFQILIKYNSDKEIIERIDTIIQKSRAVDNYILTFSFGIHKITDRSLSIDSLSDRANIARRTIKDSHVNYYAFYDDAIRNKILAEKEIENMMVSSLENEEFKVYLQPKYYINTSKIAGAEALVRWKHPKRGLISPAEFIPVFEQNGFVVNIDLFMFKKVCEKLREWLDNGFSIITISVNISRLHLHTPNVAETLYKIAKNYNVPTDHIELEITESAVINFDDVKSLIDIMNEFKKYGFKISMDDFGTGYSSLNILREMPVDILKLDQAFFDKNGDTPRGKIVISDVVVMAKHLNMITVAEGVETKEQTVFLKDIGCDMAQGYYFAKPMPVDNFEKLAFL